MAHDFLNKLVKDDGSDHVDHGYPDECFAFTSLVDSLVALVLYGGWGVQPHNTVVRTAMVVDFASESQNEAEASLTEGWNGAWELPMGSVNTKRSRTETNAQNARIERHLSLIGTDMTQQDFYNAVISGLIAQR